MRTRYVVLALLLLGLAAPAFGGELSIDFGFSIVDAVWEWIRDLVSPDSYGGMILPGGLTAAPAAYGGMISPGGLVEPTEGYGGCILPGGLTAAPAAYGGYILPGGLSDSGDRTAPTESYGGYILPGG